MRQSIQNKLKQATFGRTYAHQTSSAHAKKKSPELANAQHELLPIFKFITKKITAQQPPKPQPAKQPEPVAQVEEPRKKIVRKVSRTTKSRTVSINAILNNSSDQKKDEATRKEQTIVREELTEDFTLEQLMIHWKELPMLFEKQPQFAIIVAQEPILHDQYRITLPLENSIQEQHLWEIKPKIIGHLHRTLRNTKIEVEGQVMKHAIKRTILTDGEKLQAMVKSNPIFAKFKEIFDLELGE